MTGNTALSAWGMRGRCAVSDLRGARSEFPRFSGQARLAITDRGLTFATNGDRGVLISFSTPVRGLDPLGILRHPELTVTVADVDRLAALLRARAGLRARCATV